MAVYTKLSDKEIANFLTHYALAPLDKAQGISAGVENTNYLLWLEDGTRLVLTVFEKRVQAEDLPFFTELMFRLAYSGLPCPKPLQAKDGLIIKQIKGKPAVLVTFLAGKSTLSITPGHLAELGKYMAKMHLAAKGMPIPPPNTMGAAAWAKMYGKIGTRLDVLSHGLSRQVAQELDYLEQSWDDDLEQGVIHADLFPDNVFFDEKGQLSGLIDFYFACNDRLVYDLAICLNAWCFEKDLQFNITKAKALLVSYTQEHSLPERDIAALPVMARAAALRFLLTRAHDWLFPVADALVTPKDPMEYVKKLRFHQQVRHHREYGL